MAPQGGSQESLMVRARRLSGMFRKSLLSGEQSDAETSMPRSSLTCTPSRTAMMGQKNNSDSTGGLVPRDSTSKSK